MPCNILVIYLFGEGGMDVRLTIALLLKFVCLAFIVQILIFLKNQ